MRHYFGLRTADGCEVTVTDSNVAGSYDLPPRHDLYSDSPDGYNWGYGGSGPAQLSLALLADALGNDERAQQHYQDFKFKVVSRLDKDKWELSQEDIIQSVVDLSRGRRR